MANFGVREALGTGADRNRGSAERGAAYEHGKAPGISLGKHRIRVRRTGAEDGDVWSETVRSGAVNRVGVEHTKAAWTWRLGVWGIGEGLHEQRRHALAAFWLLSFLLRIKLRRARHFSLIVFSVSASRIVNT